MQFFPLVFFCFFFLNNIFYILYFIFYILYFLKKKRKKKQKKNAISAKIEGFMYASIDLFWNFYFYADIVIFPKFRKPYKLSRRVILLSRSKRHVNVYVQTNIYIVLDLYFKFNL
jgi:hypothetical protein